MSFGCFLIFVFFVPSLIITLVVIIRNRNSGIRNAKSVWAELASSNNFIFVPRTYAEDAYIIGSYRSRYLKLETIQKPLYGLHTRITLSSERPMDSLSKFLPKNKDVINNQPSLKEAIHLLTSASSGRGQIKVEAFCQKIHYVKFLQSRFDLLSDLADAYPGIVSLGGEVISSLLTIASDKIHRLQQVATQLLYDIGWETTNRLRNSASYLLCSHCLVYCSAHTIRLSLVSSSITYYGCRACGQSRDFLNSNDLRLVAILDSNLSEVQNRHDSTLQVNWLHHRKLFDFDQVQIIQASDEDVERFAVQVGNDTDPVRKPRYKQMPCTIAPDCQLSENTMRILQNTFGKVEVKAIEVQTQ